MKNLITFLGRAVFACGISAAYVFSARADLETNLIPSADTTLFETTPDNNLGINANTLAGNTASNARDRALMQFDLSGIPVNATISTASLTMTVAKAAAGPDSTFELHRMLVSWNEGLGDGNQGAPANTNETTWNNRFYPSTFWSTNGAGAGTDYASLVSGSTVIGSGVAVVASTPALVADVQAWVNTPASNFGWILICQDESTARTARRIASREDTANAPVLTIQYTLPIQPAPPNIFDVAQAGNKIRFSFNAESNRTYAVEFRDSLTTGGWSNLTSLPAQLANTTIHVTNTFSSAERYFRTRTP